MRMDAEETFTEGNKDRDMEDGIGSQLMQLNPVNKQESTKKFVDWNGQATEEEVSKSYPETLGGIWDSFIPWDLHRPIAC